MLFAEKIPTLVVVGVVLASLGTAVAEKPGFCPAVQGAGPCIITCETDNDCTGDMKCCSNGCGFTCQPPEQQNNWIPPPPIPPPPIYCSLPRDPGHINCPGRKQKRVYFDPVKCKCKYFRYNGCGGNGNNFKTLKECKQTCAAMDCPVCRLPKDPGPCNGFLPRFFYNIQTCLCEPFIYGGCGGNANRYLIKNDCEKVCGSFGCPICNQHKAGACKKFELKWYFDAITCKCRFFLYGGCAGNRNRFSTKADCEGSCGSFKCPVCTQPMRVGPCNKSIRRFYYDPLQNRCKVFKWGGCDPNGNNFNIRKSCDKICRGSICSLPLKNEPCPWKIPEVRFYYDSNIKKCRKFLWIGCQSNGNNFKLKRRCRRVCEKK